MTEYALRLANGQDTAPRMRMGDALPMTAGSGTLGTRAGLRPGGGDVTVQAGTMSVDVSPFMAWVDGGTSDAQGGYPFVSDATKTLTIAAGDATSDRVDTIVAQVRDNTYDGSGATDAQVLVVQGTPGAGAPALPTTCVPLRDVNVPAGLSAGNGGLAASNLGADRRTYTAALGGIVPVRDATDRDAMGAGDGQVVYRMDTGNLEKRHAGAWQAVGTAGQDRLVVVSSAAGQSVPNTTYTTVTFDTADENPGGIYNAATKKLTVVDGGLYRVVYTATLANNATGVRIGGVQVNGVNAYRTGMQPPSGFGATLQGTATLRLAAGDVVTLQVFQNSGGPLALSTDDTKPRLSMAWLRP